MYDWKKMTFPFLSFFGFLLTYLKGANLQWYCWPREWSVDRGTAPKDWENMTKFVQLCPPRVIFSWCNFSPYTFGDPKCVYLFFKWPKIRPKLDPRTFGSSKANWPKNPLDQTPRLFSIDPLELPFSDQRRRFHAKNHMTFLFAMCIDILFCISIASVFSL